MSTNWLFWKDATSYAVSMIKDFVQRYGTFKQLCDDLEVSQEDGISLLNECYELDDTIPVPDFDGNFRNPKDCFEGEADLTRDLLELLISINPETDLHPSTLAMGRIRNKNLKPLAFFTHFADIITTALQRDGDPTREKLARAYQSQGFMKAMEPKSASEKALYDIHMKACVQGIANGLRMLGSPSDGDKKRWGWELIQNAKDTVKSSGKRVKIVIDANDERVVFQHDGQGFEYSELYAMMYKCSDGKKPGRTTGRFGTGFASTHVLSRIVDIEGDVHDDGELKGFHVTLDRRGSSEADFRKGLENTHKSLQLCKERRGWTKFTYSLPKTDAAREIRDKGIESLKSDMPLVLLFEPSIDSVEIRESYSSKKRVTRFSAPTQKSTSTCEYSVEIQDNEGIHVRRFLLSRRDIEHCGEHWNLECVIEVDQDNNIVRRDNQDPFFCTFPLIGTSKFRLPMVINSSLFEPTTERNALLLFGDEQRFGQLTEVGINRRLLGLSKDLYKNLVEFCSSAKMGKLYHLAAGLNRTDRQTLDRKWYEESYLSPLQKIVKEARVFRRKSGLFPWSEVVIPYDTEAEIPWSEPGRAREEDAPRREFWDLVNLFVPNAVDFEDSVKWGKIWPQVGLFGFGDLVKRIEQCRSMSQVPDSVGDKWEYLNRLFQYAFQYHKSMKDLQTRRIVPNQDGTFGTFKTLVIQEGKMSENLRELLSFLCIDSNADRFIHSKIERRVLDQMPFKVKCSDLQYFSQMIRNEIAAASASEPERFLILMNYTNQMQRPRFMNSNVCAQFYFLVWFALTICLSFQSLIGVYGLSMK